MARTFLYFITILIVLVIAALLALRIWSKDLTRMAFVPLGHFEQLAPLPVHAYDNPDMWLAHPGMVDDPAQWLPEGVARPQPTRAWVFFVHPTSYLARDHWNGPLDDYDTRKRAAVFARGMASAFNGAATIWAPRYRQAALGAFLIDRPDTHQALNVAYGDVEAAFANFLDHVPAGAPIVLAGHSQGALHVLHLLRDKVRGTPLADRIVAVYAVGWPVSLAHDMPALGMPACNDPNQTGCLASWMSFAEPADPSMLLDAYKAQPGYDGKPHGNEPVLCTNPLTGRAGGSAPASANLGTFTPAQDLQSATIVPRSVPARCDGRGILLIGDPPDLGPFVLPGNNYHVFDIPLFWMNVRADVARREAAWWKAHPAATRTATARSAAR